MSEAMEVGKKLVAMCQQKQWMGAIDALYSADVVSIEAMAPGDKSPRMDGIAAVKGKTEWWEANHEVHSSTVEGPWPHGDRFIVRFTIDVTPKVGPMAGKRFTLSEAGLYTVKGGKVVQEEFFYHMGA